MDEVGNFIGDYINNKNNNSEFNTGKTVEEAKKQDKFFEKDTTITDSSQPANNVRIPEGFKIANDSATIVEDGIVIEDKVGNQFVWIPAKTDSGTVVHTSKGDVIMVYKRTDFGKNNGSYNDYSEIMLNDEKTSINNNGGYYIGRYEAGDKQSTNAKTMRKSVSNKTNTITIKKNQVPYNYISYEDADKLAKEMKKEQGYKATTKLTSSYAWDTTISFIQIKNEDYGINSEEGNYYNTTFEYTDVIGKKQIKEEKSQKLIPTGQTIPTCNIYDLGGNCWEMTTESYDDVSSSISYRGGFYSSLFAGGPAGYRYNISGDANDRKTFRIALFL